MNRVGAHLERQLAQPLDDRIGKLVVEPGKPKDPACTIADHVPDQALVGVERPRKRPDRGLQHRHMAILVDRRGKRMAKHRCNLGLLQPGRDRSLDQSAQPLIVERLEHVPDQPRCSLADPGRGVGTARRGLEKPAYGSGDVNPAHPPSDHRRGEEIILEELRQRFADPVLVLGDDRGVRDRYPERMAEQRRHREPVGKPTDHRRLGKRLDEPEPRIGRLQPARGDESRRHHHQQPGRDRLHVGGSRLGQGRAPGRPVGGRNLRVHPGDNRRFALAVHSAGCGIGPPGALASGIASLMSCARFFIPAPNLRPIHCSTSIARLK